MEIARSLRRMIIADGTCDEFFAASREVYLVCINNAFGPLVSLGITNSLVEIERFVGPGSKVIDTLGTPRPVSLLGAQKFSAVSLDSRISVRDYREYHTMALIWEGAKREGPLPIACNSGIRIRREGEIYGVPDWDYWTNHVFSGQLRNQFRYHDEHAVHAPGVWRAGGSPDFARR